MTPSESIVLRESQKCPSPWVRGAAGPQKHLMVTFSSIHSDDRVGAGYWRRAAYWLRSLNHITRDLFPVF
jgi:hypothetical protein